ncbi:hypothetical protein ACC755_09675 [Rhizobium ruizarguesonis]|uniref:hypothetical protein n=1 Tax=Rhizobium ruizarguesonis TaxID=2081791 RepID=UPI001031602D|nr:hypothetical protein [Rhizobium ruizarguesonis]TAY93133.1 hypothetical protein ELH85_08080 [Rhizobium ruizarguesonis]
MVEWFFDNFEDPAEKTPHASSDGGYQYIWGGPYDASEELYSHFGDVANEELIQAAVDQVQEDGLFDWAPKHIGDDLPTEDEDLNGPGDDEDYNEPDDAAGFQPGAFQDNFVNPTEVLVTPEQTEALRLEMLSRFDRLEALVRDERERAHRSHNHPPELLERDPPLTEEQQQQVLDLIAEGRQEADAETPDPAVVIQKASLLRRLAVMLGKGFAWVIGGSATTYVGNHGAEILDNATTYVATHRGEIIHALHAAADAATAWAQHLHPLF